MRTGLVLPAIAAILRVAACAGSGMLTRSVQVQRALTVADVLPAPVSAVPREDAPFTVPSGVRIVTTVHPGAEKVGDYLADLIGGSSPEPGNDRPTGAIALLIDEASEDPTNKNKDESAGEDAKHGAEAYALEIDSDGVTIRANTAAGLFWGVQTLRQLTPPIGPIVLPAVRITDRPRFAYRGVMLDVARHFFDVATVKRLIDLATMYKINHLHLHLSDDQGWRIAIDGWPRLTEVGAGTQVGGGAGGYYTADDYREIVAFAQDRFMTVVPEIDVPGHTNAALVAYPELAYDRVVPRQYTGTMVGLSALCPNRELTGKFLNEVLGEIAAMTPGPYLHIGGDEALTMPADDYAAVVTQAQAIVTAQGKTAIGWHELAGTPLQSTTILQFWGVTPWAGKVVAAAKAGHQLIMSPADRTYLDQRHELWDGTGRTWAGPISPERAYRWDPTTYLPGVPESAILGIEAPLWTELVSTREQIEHQVFPRLAAIAEIGWSPRSTHDWSAFRRRLGAQAPRWEALGIRFARVAGVPWVRTAAE